MVGRGWEGCEDVPLLKRDPPLTDTAHPNVFGTHRKDGYAEEFEVGFLLAREHGD